MSAPDGLAAFADPLGPRGRKEAAVASAAGGALLLALLVLALQKFEAEGQFERDRWDDVFSSGGAEFLFEGLVSTLKAAATAVTLSVVVGTLMALGRLSPAKPVRWLASTYVEVFRALPSLLLILFAFFALPELGVPIGKYSALVLGLSLYNSAVIAEIVRAGILSLPKGQTEAAMAIGLTRRQAQALVVLPQAVSRMLPSLVAQGVVVLKDTSYGSIIAYEELLRRGQLAGDSTGDFLPFLLTIAVVYVVVCFAFSQLARWLEGRQRRRYGRAGVVVAGDGGDASAPGAA